MSPGVGTCIPSTPGWSMVGRPKGNQELSLVSGLYGHQDLRLCSTGKRLDSAKEASTKEQLGRCLLCRGQQEFQGHLQGESTWSPRGGGLNQRTARAGGRAQPAKSFGGHGLLLMLRQEP